jgi:small subunit ribosomal protein S6
MRRYETVVILDPEMGDDDIRGFTDRYAQLIKSSGGEVIKIEDWGQKKLAYLVNKKNRGRYILLDFVGMPALIQEMERQFKISEAVMKFLSVKLDQDVDLEAFKAAAAKTEAAAAEPAVEQAPAPEPAPEPEQPAETAAAPEQPPAETAAEPEAPSPEAQAEPSNEAATEEPAEATSEPSAGAEPEEEKKEA